MSVLIFIGECGGGKTSLAMATVDDYINKRGAERYEFSEKTIRELNADRKQLLDFPVSLPVYSNTDFGIEDAFGNNIKPIPITGAQIGINDPTDKKPKYVYLYPASLVLFDEAQNEFPMKNDNLPSGQRTFFTQRRHNDIEMILIAPRGVFIHKDVRESGATIIEVIKKTHVKNVFGTVCQTLWLCRKFENNKDFEEYQSSNGTSGNYKTVIYSHEGDVYDYYDDHEYRKNFTPPEGQQYYAGN